MPKKRFTEDLFGLFEEDTPQAEPTPTPEESSTEESVAVTVPVRTTKARRKLSSKKFTQDLDDFLADSFGETPAPSPAPAPASAPKKRRVPRRKTGLDFLIRSTVSEEQRTASTRGNNPETKRVTLIFNKKHLAELKEQAADRKMYLKDVVQEMVASYLDAEK